MSAQTIDRAGDLPAENPAHPGHRDVSGGKLRPAVFGAMDGLVTNVSLIAGIGGSGASAHTIILTGVAGLVAGAFSMATGEYVSVTTQNESVRAEVDVERSELAAHPEAEERELATALVRRGVSEATARKAAAEISQDSERALEFHAQEELGVDAGSLPSPWTAATASFVFFAIGAVLPLITYLCGVDSLALALGVSAVALFLAGAVTARFTGRGVVFSGLRQLGLGALAAAVTFAVGHAIGVATA